jgi:hypothetical protein
MSSRRRAGRNGRELAAELDPATGLMTRGLFEQALQNRLLQAGEKGLRGCALHARSPSA